MMNPNENQVPVSAPRRAAEARRYSSPGRAVLGGQARGSGPVPGRQASTRAVRVSMHYPDPPETVWAAIATREALSDWFMTTDFEPEEGREFTFQMPPKPGFDGTIRCEVFEVVPLHRLVYAWSGAWGSKATTVTWELTREGDGTCLHLEHAGFKGLSGFLLSRMMKMGWGNKLRKAVPTWIEAKQQR